MEYVYHVVTERPLLLGQKITFSKDHRNSVYQRVMTWEKIIKGEEVDSDVARLIKSDLEHWSEIAYRELALEKVRQKEYPHYPSRMACLYTSRNLDNAKIWADFFQKSGRNIYAIVKLKTNGRVFDGDARNCFKGTSSQIDNVEKARHYWENDIFRENSVIETLIDGDIWVEEIIVDFKKE